MQSIIIIRGTAGFSASAAGAQTQSCRRVRHKRHASTWTTVAEPTNCSHHSNETGCLTLMNKSTCNWNSRYHSCHLWHWIVFQVDVEGQILCGASVSLKMLWVGVEGNMHRRRNRFVCRHCKCQSCWKRFRSNLSRWSAPTDEVKRFKSSVSSARVEKSSVLSPLLVFILLRCEQPEKMWRKCQESQVIAAGFIVKWEFLVLGSCSDSVFILMIRSRWHISLPLLTLLLW